MNLLGLILVVTVAFAVCFAAMAIGLLLRGRRMRGGCSDEPDVPDGRLAACGLCPKKKVNLCDTDDPSGLPEIAELSTLGRYRKPGE
jgi:hypothetical protein